MKFIHKFAKLFIVIAFSLIQSSENISLLNTQIKSQRTESSISCNSKPEENNQEITIIAPNNYLETSSGQILFKFVPASSPSYDIPFDLKWPEYLQNWIQTWIPLCGILHIEEKSSLLSSDFGVLKRENKETIHKYNQITYKGWGLYLNPDPNQHVVLGLWEKVYAGNEKGYLNDEKQPEGHNVDGVKVPPGP